MPSKYVCGCAVVAVTLLAAGGAVVTADEPVRTTATGIVFEDLNGDGKHDANEPGIPGIAVSNQADVVVTNAQGRYVLPVTDDTIIFVTKPSGYAVPLDKDNIPRFYYIHKPNGSPTVHHGGVAPTGPMPDSIDFPLVKQDEPRRFKVLALGDIQPQTSQEVFYARDDVFNELVGTDAVFGLTLGDNVSDHLWLYGYLNDFMGKIGIPFYRVIGNHDMNYDAEDDQSADETFHRLFGPNYYSWDYAQVHFVALDTIVWQGREKDRYLEELPPGQLAWLANDVKHVSKDKLIVLLMHAPLSSVRAKLIPGTETVFEILKDRPRVLALAGHTHVQEHVFFKPEDGWKGEGRFHELICVTVCGSWWSGPKDVWGIPVADQRDGVPNGYVIVEFDGADYTTTYKAAGLDRAHQMRIYPPGGVDTTEEGRRKLLVNVYDGSEKCQVVYSLDRAPFKPMDFKPQFDPLAVILLTGVVDSGKPWARPVPAPHMWETMLPEPPTRGTHIVTIRVTDHYDRTYEQSKIFSFR